MNLSEYPKERTLKDGSKVTLRPMVREDEAGLMEFFSSLPEVERRRRPRPARVLPLRLGGEPEPVAGEPAGYVLPRDLLHGISQR